MNKDYLEGKTYSATETIFLKSRIWFKLFVLNGLGRHRKGNLIIQPFYQFYYYH